MTSPEREWVLDKDRYRRETRAAAVMMNCARTVLGESFVGSEAFVRYRSPTTKGLRHSSGEEALRKKYGPTVVNFIYITGWQGNNPELQQVLTGLYLSALDESLRRYITDFEPADLERMRGQRLLMDEVVTQWQRRREVQEVLAGREEELAIWSRFFSVRESVRKNILSNFRANPGDEAREKAYQRLAQEDPSDASSAPEQKSGPLVVHLKDGTQQVPDRDALMRALRDRRKGPPMRPRGSS